MGPPAQVLEYQRLMQAAPLPQIPKGVKQKSKKIKNKFSKNPLTILENQVISLT